MKTIIVLSVLAVIITTPGCYCSATDEDTRNDTTTDGDVGIDGMDISIEAQTVNIIKENKDCDDSNGARGLQGLRGEKGIQGEQGPPGPPGGGAIYTRWGRTVCPDTNGTELVYKGLVAGTHYNHYGGGANYLCLTKDIKYLTTSTVSSYSTLFAAEYRSPRMSSLGSADNVPCAVCHNSERSSKLMIPGTTSCPTSWTSEYQGYLMTEYHGHRNNRKYECIDKFAEAVPGESRCSYGALFYHVGGVCNVGLPCPPMVANRPITCVVCTK